MEKVSNSSSSGGDGGNPVLATDALKKSNSTKQGKNKSSAKKQTKQSQNKANNNAISKKSTPNSSPQKKDDSFGRKGFYAGAGFDRSPAAHTLPVPSFLKSPGKPLGAASSSDAMAIPQQRNSKSSVAKSLPAHLDPKEESDEVVESSEGADDLSDLRDKSRRLMAMLREGESRKQVAPVAVVEREKEEGNDLEAMTQEVRRMLRLS